MRYHLAKVYACLTATTATAAVGSVVHLSGLWEAGLLSAIGSIVLVLMLTMSADNSKNFYTRLGMLLGFGLLSGHSLGPLLDHVIAVQPQIVVTSLIGTCVVFVSFSCAALLAERGKFLYLGGLLMSILSTMTLFSLANLFMQSQVIYQVCNAIYPSSRPRFYILHNSLIGTFVHWVVCHGRIYPLRYPGYHGETTSWQH